MTKNVDHFSSLSFFCSRHGQQEGKIDEPFIFGGFIRVTLDCGCIFDKFPGAVNPIAYVGRIHKIDDEP